MGPLQIAEQCDDLPDYYDDGKDVVSYRAQDWDQLVSLIKQYLADEPARAKIARAGWERTVRDHVWTVRWSEIEEQARPIMEETRRKPRISTSEPQRHTQGKAQTESAGGGGGAGGV